MTLTLHNVSRVVAGAEPNMYIVTCEITDLNNETYECDYVSRENDSFGLNPTVRDWIAANPLFPIEPYVEPAPPTPEEIRQQMPPLTARQFRLGLVDAGISPSTITATIAAMPAGADRDKAQIEWEYATTFNRMHSLIATVGAALGFTEAQIDAMWLGAIDL